VSYQSERLVIRPATAGDVPAIVAMLADDKLGALRETPDDIGPYLAAFEQIAANPASLLVYAETSDGKPAGTLQLMFLQGLGRKGATRAQIESVRIHSSMRGTGLGTELMKWAVETARDRGAFLVQLTSDASRGEAHRFYERLGFVRSHAGYKMQL
jgi:GNAT superfamily N-acetyltransferase